MVIYFAICFPLESSTSYTNGKSFTCISRRAWPAYEKLANCATDGLTALTFRQSRITADTASAALYARRKIGQCIFKHGRIAAGVHPQWGTIAVDAAKTKCISAVVISNGQMRMSVSSYVRASRVCDLGY
jgi:hypothetical protein